MGRPKGYTKFLAITVVTAVAVIGGAMYVISQPGSLLTIEEVREVYLTVADRVGQFPDADRYAFIDYVLSGPPLWDLESEVPESYYGTICHVQAKYPEVLDGFQDYVSRINCGGSI